MTCLTLYKLQSLVVGRETINLNKTSFVNQPTVDQFLTCIPDHYFYEAAKFQFHQQFFYSELRQKARLLHKRNIY